MGICDENFKQKYDIFVNSTSLAYKYGSLVEYI